MVAPLALVLALLLPLLLTTVLIKDRRTRVLILFLAWGSVAGLLSFYVNLWIIGMSESELQEAAVQVGPLVEEFFKALPLLCVFASASAARKEKDSVLMGTFSGIGFSIVENYYYLTIASDFSPVSLAAFMVTRSLSTTIMHGLSTGLVGFAVYYASNKGHGQYGAPWMFVIVAFSCSVMFHSLFNLYVQLALFGSLIAVSGALLMYLLSYVLFESYHDKI